MEILFLTPRFPYPPLKGDQVRAYHHIRDLSTNHEVMLVAMTARPVSDAHRAEVEQYCEAVKIVQHSTWKQLLRAGLNLVTGRSINTGYYASTSYAHAVDEMMSRTDPDVVFAQLIRTAPYAIKITDRPVVIDFVDALSLNMERRAERSGLFTKWIWKREARKLSAIETQALRAFSASFVTSEVDANHLKEMSTDAPQIIPNGVDTDRFHAAPQHQREPRTLIFSGNMSYHPNIEAVQFFAGHVLDKIVDQVPNVRFEIVGANPSKAVQELDDHPNILVRGFVESIADELRRSSVSVCPLQSGAGIQNKVLEAMSTGTPVVATPLAVAGVRGAKAGEHYLEGHSPDTLAESILALLESKEERARLASNARAFIEKHYRWSATTAQIQKRLEQLV